MDNKIYGLYKRIMKHDPKAIDELKSLDEAKKIIRMITGNIYLNGEVYQTDHEIRNNLISGNKDTMDIIIEKLTANRDLNMPDVDVDIIKDEI